MAGYYRDPVYIDGGYFDAPSPAAARESPETAIFREALERLESRRCEAGLPAAGRLLDVGSGSGSFLKLAASRGWQAAGVELSPELAARAAERSGSPVACGDFPALDLPAGAFDAVTLWDVLEHTTDPGAFLDRAREMLAPGGVLVVFTIDAASLFNVAGHLVWTLTLGRMTSPLELLYDKRHNHYFTSATLRRLIEGHGLRIHRVVTHRAHLRRWLSEPAGRLVLAVAEVLDLLSVPLRRPYRQLLYVTAGGGS